MLKLFGKMLGYDIPFGLKLYGADSWTRSRLQNTSDLLAENPDQNWQDKPQFPHVPFVNLHVQRILRR